jgi:hypothetical protein
MDASSAKRSMVFGGIMFLVGLVITVGSFTAATDGNGTQRYVVAWGAMIFGGIRFIYGAVKLSQSNNRS